ncbi:MAG: hypothetical protein ACP5UV_03365 [Thermoplasmata archaeon]
MSFKTDVISKLDELSKKIDEETAKDYSVDIKNLVEGYAEDIKKDIDAMKSDIIADLDQKIGSLSSSLNEAIRSLNDAEKTQKAKKETKEKSK